MQFSDTSNDQGIIQDITFWTGVNTTTYTTKHRTRNVNLWLHKVWTMILDSAMGSDEADVNWTDKVAIVTRPLVANQRDYLFSTALWDFVDVESGTGSKTKTIQPIKIKRVDVCYSGIGGVCYRAEKLDATEFGIGLGNDSNLDGHFSRQEPSYDLSDVGIRLYPRASAANVTANGVVRVSFGKEPKEFTITDTTQKPGFDSAFHRMLSLGASLDWEVKQNADSKKVRQITSLLVDYEARLRQHYAKKQESGSFSLKAGYIDYE